MIYELIDKFKGLWYGESKCQIEGYMIMSDSTNSKTLLLIKDGEKSWKTKWFSDSQTNYIAPVEPLSSIFKNNVLK
jgi:hypothetical protein